jgi:D-amino peptidase
MKVFVSVDMEGISGLVRWQDVIRDGMDYPRNRRLMTQDANAAVAGAFEGGASEVVVEENHGVEDLCDLVIDEVDPRCRVVRGAGRPTATTMAGLDAGAGVVLLVGHHARAGSFPGIMAHTVSYTEFSAVRLAGRDCGEPEIFAIRAGELGVPVGFVSGDQVVIEQLRKRVPDAEAAEVKRALSNVAGDVIPPARAREAIRAGARRAVERARAGELAPYRGETAPYEIEVELRKPPGEHLRENLARLPEFELAGERTIRTVAPDMDLGFRRIAYLGYGNRPGTLRY